MPSHKLYQLGQYVSNWADSTYKGQSI